MSAALSGTKIDSAARHNVVARVCESFMSQFRLSEEIQQNKHSYCCKKNELLLGIGRPFNADSGVSIAEDKAYLPVISNVGIFHCPGQDGIDLQDWYVELYDARTPEDVSRIAKSPCRLNGCSYYPSELYLAGVALTTGWAHHLSGDTALTCMIGGTITVQNGHYQVCVGDKIQWYLPAEGSRFLKNGRRRNLDDAPGDMVDNPISEKERRTRDNEYREIAKSKKFVYPKPYLLDFDGKGASVMDERRIFAIALSSAGPYEPLDLKLSVQQL